MASNDSTSDILDKLEYLDDTKQQIRTALNNKGLNIDTITPFRNYATEIDTLHIGTDTTDADATSYDIINPRTAYVNDQKITGRIPKITNKFSFDNIEITQTNIEEISIKDYTMNNGQIFHEEYFEGINLVGKNFLIYMREGLDESSAIVFTWNNTETLHMTLNNNTMTLTTYFQDTETNSLITYTDLFLSGTPTKTEGSYTGNYFGNNSYFTTSNIYCNEDLIFKADEKYNYDYLTIDQTFDETKAISSEASNIINIKQEDIANIAGLIPDILKSGNKVLNIEGTLQPIRLFESIEEMDNSQGNKENDLGVVYSENIKEEDVQEGDIVTLNFLPDTFSLDEEVETSVQIRLYLRAIDYSSSTSSYIYVEHNSIRGELRVLTMNRYNYFYFNYRSEDGINFTKDYEYNEGIPDEVILYRIFNEDTYNIIPKLFKQCDYVYEGIYKYSNNTDVEIFNNITNFKCNEIDNDGNISYSYYTENNKFRLPRLYEIVQNIFIEQDLSNNGYFGVYLDKNTNKIKLINKQLYIIYDHQSGKSYIGITTNEYSEWNIEQYKAEFETKTIKTIETLPLADYFFIIDSFDNIEYITTGNYNISASSSYVDSINLSLYLYRILDGTRTSLGTNPDIKYNNTSFEAYHHIKTLNNLEYKYQLLPNVTALGIHGLLKGDGSYIRRITNKEFIDNYLDGNTSYNSPDGIVTSGTSVPYQTFVSTEPIICNYRTGEDVNSTDCITYTNKETINSSIDLNDETFIDEYQSCPNSTVSTTFYHNKIPYYIRVKFEGVEDTSEGSGMNVWTTITKVTAIIFNQLTGEIFKTFKCTTTFNPSTNRDSSGYMQSCGYSFSEDKLYLLFNTGRWAWSNAIYCSFVTISNTGTLSIQKFTFNPSGSGVQSYKHLSQSGTCWDDINNQFYALIETFNTDGADHRYNGIALINSNGATHIRQNTDPNYSMYASNLRGQGPLFQYKDGSSQKYVLLDASTNTIILQNMNSSLNIIGINDYQYYAYEGNLYKYNPLTHSATIINNEYIGTNVHRVLIDNIEYLFNGLAEGHIYDTEGNLIKNVTNMSSNGIIEEIDDYTRRINSLYSYSVLDYAQGERITTKTDYIRTYHKWFEVTSFPYEGDLYITLGNSNYNRLNKTNKCYAKQLSKSPVSKKEYQENINITNDILGIN